MPDVVCLGELLIDFVPTVSGVTLVEAPAFTKAPGGAPANVAVGLARLGVSSVFLGKVGDDAFGHFLAQALADNGVDVSSLRFSTQARTALAFVSLTAEGERDFMFYRHPSADMLFTPEEVAPAAIRAARLFHFGSISLIDEPVRSATLRAAQIAQEAGLFISYDPNLRLPLWPHAEAARAGIRLGWPFAHVIKLSAEEVAFLSGSGDALAGARALWHDGLRLLVVTHGAAGCTYLTATVSGDVPGFEVQAVDATGAGDGFTAALLRGLLKCPTAFEDQAQLVEICRYANAVGALTTTARGAIPALPTAERVAAFLRAFPNA